MTTITSQSSYMYQSLCLGAHALARYTVCLCVCKGCMHCQGYQVTMAIEQSKCAMSGVLRRHSTITLRAHECLHLHQHTTGATSNLVDLNYKRKYCCDKKPYTPLLSCRSTCVLVQPILNLGMYGG